MSARKDEGLIGSFVVKLSVRELRRLVIASSASKDIGALEFTGATAPTSHLTRRASEVYGGLYKCFV
jgi:hypothetical protein